MVQRIYAYTAALATLVVANPCACKHVTVDVLIAGGGASGSYAAAQLADVHNKSVLLVDRAPRLGGHVNTIRVPGVDQPIDFGVFSYHNLSVTEPFFNRYGIEVEVGGPGSFTSVFLDQKTGRSVNATMYSADEQQAALGRWLEFGLKYKNYIYPYYNLPTPLGDAAPLARPFIETVKELKLESIVLSLGDAHWSNDLLALPTLQAVSTFGFPWFDGTPLVVPKSRNNSELYANIEAHLSDRVLLNSQIQSVDRSHEGKVIVHIKSPTGCTKVTAKQMVVSFVPTLDNMRPFDATHDEKRLFTQWNCTTLFNGLLTVNGMPDGMDFDPVSSDPSRYFVPTRPAARFINFAGTPYTVTYVVGEDGFNAHDAQKFLEGRLATIAKAGTYNVSGTPKYWDFDNHSPIVCSVDEKAMTGGFWSDVTALQGRMNTWYIGQAFAADLSAYVWAQAQEVVDKIVQKL